ncbi:uncharacterized protein N7459_001427 [Penicillium hispanicum]|uniref:uncharacterized protein n=1 Tax=Penicillium hispanicum TaxID=1080232 RepID=UPI002540AA9A|nr:uncharacterized protein N7459_001427 [Penicillium hispanicum]KAJ5595219.1 hypothetical protein N7459_001427 [Penicillium hispanicum]
MALRLLVNAGLLVIPIGGSLGALFGIDAHRSATGQPPLFSNDNSDNAGSGTGSGSGSTGGSTGGGSGGSGSTTNNGVTNTQYCELSYGISPPTDGEQFVLNPNQWGVTTSSSGALCMNVTTFNNETYPTKTTAPEWSVTWQFEPGPSTQPVHAFPNIMVEDVLPLALDQMSEINFDVHWTYGIGNKAVETTPADSELIGNGLNTNVAIDMFFDSDKTAAQNSSAAKYEVMVWFADIGASAQTIGQAQGVVTSRTLGSTIFNLYSGTNDETHQTVLTWVANSTTEKFSGDIYPLITDLYSLSGTKYPSKDDYMGIFQFGTETYSANSNVTFSARTLSIDIKT